EYLRVTMEKKYLAVLGLTVLLVFVIGAAFNVGVYSKTYRFTYATQLQNPDGTVVFHLADGSALNFSNAYTREHVKPSEMTRGGYIVVQYSFINYPVQVDYLLPLPVLD